MTFRWFSILVSSNLLVWLVAFVACGFSFVFFERFCFQLSAGDFCFSFN